MILFVYSFPIPNRKTQTCQWKTNQRTYAATSTQSEFKHMTVRLIILRSFNFLKQKGASPKNFQGLTFQLSVTFKMSWLTFFRHVLPNSVPTKCKSSWKFWKKRGNFLFKVTTNLIYKLNLENVRRQTYVDVLTEARFLWNPATICFDLYREDLTVLRMPNASSLTYQSFLLSRRWQMHLFLQKF